jgi:hypothetical protein
VARDLDRQSKQPLGSIYPYVHLHSARLSLTHVPDRSHLSVCSLGKKLIVSIGELTQYLITDLQRE